MGGAGCWDRIPRAGRSVTPGRLKTAATGVPLPYRSLENCRISAQVIVNADDRTGSLMTADLKTSRGCTREAVWLPNRGYFGGDYPVPGTGVEDDKKSLSAIRDRPVT